MTSTLLATLIAVFAPLGGFLLSAMLGRRNLSRVIAIAAISSSLLAAIYVFIAVWGHSPLHVQWTWFTIGQHTLQVGVLVDGLSAVMLLLVPLIALPVHIYSVAYMAGDAGTHRYWMYLSLFCSAMAGLVVADNLLVMYVFWELVGFASYLLIGYWFTKESAVRANLKAFIINRIGDVGFLIGIALVYTQFGSLDIHYLFGDGGAMPRSTVHHGVWYAGEHSLPAVWLTVAGLVFFIGAMAKSAQFPFHVWLADAMEGPTSVSSLIHAATMVAAGVFLLVRIFPIFDEHVLLTIAWIGSITALLAAFFAITQNDIKKILAFSTVSQLGLMMVSVGTGNYAIAMFYLVVHAFFKCVLFLGAGAVIQELGRYRDKHTLDFDPQDIRNMGGLRHFMPTTCTVMVVAALTLSAIPLTAGYLSKDLLLISTLEWGSVSGGLSVVIPIILVITSAMTAFYIARCIFKVFFGKPRMPQPLGQSSLGPREAPKQMLVPMIFLAAGTLFPLFASHPLQIDGLWLVEGLSGTIASPTASHRVFNTLIPLITTSVSTILAWIAWRWYARGLYQPNTANWLYRFSFHQGYFDNIYQAVIVGPFIKFSYVVKAIDTRLVDGAVDRIGLVGQRLASITNWFDFYIVDGFVRTVGKFAVGLGNVLRHSQTGRVQHYVYLMFFVVLVVLIYHLFSQG